MGIDGFDVLTGNRILLSFTRQVTVGGSIFQPSDLVLYSNDNLDSRSKGSYQMILDGSDVGLKRRGENITGVSQDPLTGDFLITVSGSFSAQGVTASSRDIVRFQPDRLGNRTRGSWKLETTGDDLGLARNSRGLDALSEVNESLLISTRDSEPLPGLSGNRSDIIKIPPSDGASNKGSTFTKSFGRLDRNNVIGIDIL